MTCSLLCADFVQDKLFQLWINTFFVEQEEYVIPKPGLDKAAKDKNKIYAKDFNLTFVFTDITGLQFTQQAPTRPRGLTLVPLDSAPAREEVKLNVSSSPLGINAAQPSPALSNLLKNYPSLLAI
jgi:hypothetical protein